MERKRLVEKARKGEEPEELSEDEKAVVTVKRALWRNLDMLYQHEYDPIHVYISNILHSNEGPEDEEEKQEKIRQINELENKWKNDKIKTKLSKYNDNFEWQGFLPATFTLLVICI